MASSRSRFLDLPLELRLHIYDYALAEPTAITISTAVGRADSTEQHDTHSIPGLPSNHTPVIRYFTEVSSKSDSTILPRLPQPLLDSNTEDESLQKSSSADDEVQLPFSVPFALMQTNRQTYAELTNHLSRHRKLNLSASFSESQNSSRQPSFASSSSSFASASTSFSSTFSTSSTSSRRTRRDSPLCRPGAGLRLHVTYPYGILVLKHKYPALLHQATEISITGCYTTQSPEPSARPWRMKMDESIREPPPEATITAARRALRRMTRTVLSPEPSPLLQKYSMRIFVPDGNRAGRHNDMWNDKSPVPVGLSNICGGEIDLLVKRGQIAAAMEMTVIPCPKVRAITCRHVKLDEREYLKNLDQGISKSGAEKESTA